MTDPDSPPERADRAGVAESRFLIRRRCPSCGAPVEHSDTATTVACSYCQVRLAITGVGAPARYAVPTRYDADTALCEAKRALRGEQVRVRRLDAPRVIYFPYARWRADVHALWRHPKARKPEPEHRSSWTVPATLIEVGFGPDTPATRAWSKLNADSRRPAAMRGISDLEEDEAEFQYRIGPWEQTISAQPDLAFIDHTLGVRTQALSVVPLDELVDSKGDPQLIPGRVAPRLSTEEAQNRLERQLREAQREEPGDREHARFFAPTAELQWIYFPYVAIDFTGPERNGCILLDGVTLKHRSIVDTQALATLALDAQQGDAGGWTFSQPATRFTALVCPNCSMPLRCHPSACLHPCENCRRTWELSSGTLRERRAKLLLPPRHRSSGPSLRADRALPFYVMRCGSGEAARRVFVPAAQCRHRRAIWSLASSLTRRNDPWEEVECDLRLDVPVTLRADHARGLLPFAWALAHELDAKEPAAATIDAPELVWLAMGERGGAWIEPNSGLSVSSAALTPWPSN